jgi:hypothetical protein
MSHLVLLLTHTVNQAALGEPVGTVVCENPATDAAEPSMPLIGGMAQVQQPEQPTTSGMNQW